MGSCRKATLFTLTFLLVVLPVFVGAAESADRPANLSAQAVQIEKAEFVVSDRAMQYLTAKNQETVKVWVYFTDKGVFGRQAFSAAAANVQLSDKTMARRAKMGIEGVVFADLPVKPSYINQVKDLAMKHRRTSRYLNAASFEVPMASLDAIAELPFVARITPMAGFSRDREAQPTSMSIGGAETPLGGDPPETDNYGGSFDQLNQINVLPAHQSGYDGEGVVLAIFDTGFRKSHEAFAQHYADGRVLAEYDFVNDDDNTANEVSDGDWDSQWNHGTYIWSTSAGFLDGTIYGPAYRATFILGKTEDVRSETAVEEDNWVAAVEWADSLGVDVITSSLGYSDWYVPADFDGETATITIAANTAASLGIVVCNSMGNDGPSAQTLTAPADAFNILSVGAVNSAGAIASFSSRGPTEDGRMKPEVVARGVSTYCATASGDDTYGGVNGTSLSTPLVAGCAVLMVQARPDFTPAMIRQAMMETADNASNPDNTYGWGLVDLWGAIGWGANFWADTLIGDAPLNVQFFDSATVNPTAWDWSFGDGGVSTLQNPSHEYTTPGAYDVSLTVQSSWGEITNEKIAYIVVMGDTLNVLADTVFAGSQAVVPVYMTNSQPLESITFPFAIQDSPIDIHFDSVSLGSRTAYFEALDYRTYNQNANQFTVELIADDGGGAAALPAGSGEIARIHISTDSLALGGLENPIDTFSTAFYWLLAKSSYMEYVPIFNTGTVATTVVLRGDCTNDYHVDISDLTYLVNYLYILSGSPPPTIQQGDVSNDQQVDVSDITYLVNYLFLQGDPPTSP